MKNKKTYVKLGFEIMRKSAVFSWYWGGVSSEGAEAPPLKCIEFSNNSNTSLINCRCQNRPTCSLWVFYVLITLSMHRTSLATECNRLWSDVDSSLWRRSDRFLPRLYKTWAVNGRQTVQRSNSTYQCDKVFALCTCFQELISHEYNVLRSKSWNFL